jgi:hypothetical protein
MGALMTCLVVSSCCIFFSQKRLAPERALITVRATWAPSGLPLGSPRGTERRWR